jgi:hypothetical protein
MTAIYRTAVGVERTTRDDRKRDGTLQRHHLAHLGICFDAAQNLIFLDSDPQTVPRLRDWLGSWK